MLELIATSEKVFDVSKANKVLDKIYHLVVDPSVLLLDSVGCEYVLIQHSLVEGA